MIRRDRASRALVTVAATTILALASLTTANAANSGSSSADTTQTDQGDQDPVSHAKLEKFATAYSHLVKIRGQYVKKLQQTQDKNKRKQLQQEGQQKMVAGIRAENLKLAEYKRIGKRLSTDKDLRARLKKILDQRKANSPSGDQAN